MRKKDGHDDGTSDQVIMMQEEHIHNGSTKQDVTENCVVDKENNSLGISFSEDTKTDGGGCTAGNSSTALCLCLTENLNGTKTSPILLDTTTSLPSRNGNSSISTTTSLSSVHSLQFDKVKTRSSSP